MNRKKKRQLNCKSEQTKIRLFSSSLRKFKPKPLICLSARFTAQPGRSDSQRAVNALSALQLIGSWIIIRWILTNQGTLLTRENHLRAVRFEVNAVYQVVVKENQDIFYNRSNRRNLRSKLGFGESKLGFGE